MYEVRINLPRLTREYFNEHTGGVESSKDNFTKIEDLTDEMIEEIVKKAYVFILVEKDVVLDDLYDLGFHKIKEYAKYEIEFDVDNYTWIVRHNYPFPAKILSILYTTLARVIEYITTDLRIYIDEEEV